MVGAVFPHCRVSLPSVEPEWEAKGVARVLLLVPPLHLSHMKQNVVQIILLACNSVICNNIQGWF